MKKGKWGKSVWNCPECKGLKKFYHWMGEAQEYGATHYCARCEKAFILVGTHLTIKQETELDRQGIE